MRSRLRNLRVFPPEKGGSWGINTPVPLVFDDGLSFGGGIDLLALPDVLPVGQVSPHDQKPSLSQRVAGTFRRQPPASRAVCGSSGR